MIINLELQSLISIRCWIEIKCKPTYSLFENSYFVYYFYVGESEYTVEHKAIFIFKPLLCIILLLMYSIIKA